MKAVPSRRAIRAVAAGVVVALALAVMIVRSSEDRDSSVKVADSETSSSSSPTLELDEESTTTSLVEGSASTTTGVPQPTSTTAAPSGESLDTSEPLVLANEFIAFARYGGVCDTNDSCGLYVLDPKGGQPEKIYAGQVDDVSWAPDHSRLAFVNSEGLVVANADGTNPRLLVRHGGDDNFISGPAWSPDGRRIAFNARGHDDDPSDTFVVSPSGGQTEVLISTPGQDIFYGWAAKGRSAVISHGHEDVLLYDFSTGNERLLWRGDGTVPGGGDTGNFKMSRGHTSVSHNGLSIVRTFCSEDRHCHIFLKNFESDAPVIDLSGETTPELADTHGAFSPGGDRIAFVRAVGPDLSDTKIHVVDLASRRIERVPGGEVHYPNLAW